MKPINNIKIINHYRRWTESVLHKIDKYTIQLIVDDGNKKKPLASVILIQFEDEFFIVSAAHVIEYTDMNKIYFECGGNKNNESIFQVITEFEMISTQKVINSREEDKVDIAILRILDESILDNLKVNFSFYAFTYADINHEARIPFPSYIVFGYPTSYFNINNRFKEPERKVLILSTHIVEWKNHEKHGFSEDKHLFTLYPKKMIVGKNAYLPPLPNGNSGSGLWCFTNSFTIDDREPHFTLVGIMIEVFQKRTLIASKLVTINSILIELSKSK